MSIAIVVIGIIFIVQPKWANADDDSITYKSILKFGGGIVSAFLIHEGGHAVVGVLTGTKMDWRAGDVTQPIDFTEFSTSKERGWLINSAGLLTQAAGAEFILQYDKIDKNDSFVRGMMLWNILNPLMYALDYWVIHKTNTIDNNGYTGDLAGLEFYSSKRTADVFAGTMVAIAAFQGYRFARTQSWAPEWMKSSYSNNLALMPLPSGGAILSFSFEF